MVVIELVGEIFWKNPTSQANAVIRNLRRTERRKVTRNRKMIIIVFSLFVCILNKLWFGLEEVLKIQVIMWENYFICFCTFRWWKQVSSFRTDTPFKILSISLGRDESCFRCLEIKNQCLAPSQLPLQDDGIGPTHCLTIHSATRR